jgi:hypothetical protein
MTKEILFMNPRDFEHKLEQMALGMAQGERVELGSGDAAKRAIAEAAALLLIKAAHQRPLIGDAEYLRYRSRPAG